MSLALTDSSNLDRRRRHRRRRLRSVRRAAEWVILGTVKQTMDATAGRRPNVHFAVNLHHPTVH